MDEWACALEDMGLNPDFWRGRRVLVTGHTGFKGGWLCVWLRRLGAEIAGIALDPPTTPSLYDAARVHTGVDSRRVDINDFDATRNAVIDIEPEVVFHLAAQPLVRLSYEQPLTTISTNVVGTAHILESLRTIDSVSAVVVVTSDKCYEDRGRTMAYTESDPMGGRDPYSSSKGCAELVCAAYRSAFFEAEGIELASARAGNVHGGGDWAADRLVPDFVRRIMTGEALEVRNPGSVRPWQHVLDPLCGYMMLAERLADGDGGCAEAWNFGPDSEMASSVADVASLLVDLWGDGARWIPVGEESAPHEARFLALDSRKARERLGWRPVWNLRRGLGQTVEWYKVFAVGADVRTTMERQIAEYSTDLETLSIDPPAPDSPASGRPTP